MHRQDDAGAKKGFFNACKVLLWAAHAGGRRREFSANVRDVLSINVQSHRNIQKLDYIKSSLTAFIFRDELLADSEQMREACLRHASRLASIYQKLDGAVVS